MTAQEVYNTLVNMLPTDVATFNTVPQVNYEVWQVSAGGGLQEGELDTLIIEAKNWNDTFMDNVNAVGSVAGVKPKKDAKDVTNEMAFILHIAIIAFSLYITILCFTGMLCTNDSF